MPAKRPGEHEPQPRLRPSHAPRSPRSRTRRRRRARRTSARAAPPSSRRRRSRQWPRPPRRRAARRACRRGTRSEEQHAGGEHAHQPERQVAFGLPVARRLRDSGCALELERRNGEERHARRLVGVRAAVEHRAVEQAGLDGERVVEDEVPGQLVARPVLRAGQADRRQCGERDEREHERLEPVAPEAHAAGGYAVARSGEPSRHCPCESALRKRSPRIHTQRPPAFTACMW